MALEEEFGREIPDADAETILTVGDATKCLEKNEVRLDSADRMRRQEVHMGETSEATQSESW